MQAQVLGQARVLALVLVQAQAQVLVSAASQSSGRSSGLAARKYPPLQVTGRVTYRLGRH